MALCGWLNLGGEVTGLHQGCLQDLRSAMHMVVAAEGWKAPGVRSYTLTQHLQIVARSAAEPPFEGSINMTCMLMGQYARRRMRQLLQVCWWLQIAFCESIL